MQYKARQCYILDIQYISDVNELSLSLSLVYVYALSFQFLWDWLSVSVTLWSTHLTQGRQWKQVWCGLEYPSVPQYKQYTND